MKLWVVLVIIRIPGFRETYSRKQVAHPVCACTKAHAERKVCEHYRKEGITVLDVTAGQEIL